MEAAHADLTREIIGAAYEVHRVLGPGFLESIYEKSLVRELRLRSLTVRRQVRVPIYYKDTRVGEHYLDLLVNDQVIVELKCVQAFHEVHTAIAISYLTATKLPVALLLNFQSRSLEIKRIAR